MFLLDTGATDVVVSQDLAERTVLQAGAMQQAQTANGRIHVRATRLDRLQLGTIELHDVSASINPLMGGDKVLLDMSALGGGSVFASSTRRSASSGMWMTVTT